MIDLRLFCTKWLQYRPLGTEGSSRSETEDLQRFTVRLAEDLLLFDAMYPASSDLEVRNKIHTLSTALKRFGTTNLTGLSALETATMNAHGGMAYDLATALVTHLETKGKD